MTQAPDDSAAKLSARIMKLDPKRKALALAKLDELVREQQREQAQPERRD